MKTTFDLGPYELTVDDDVPRAISDPASVHLQVTEHHLPVVPRSEEEKAEFIKRGWTPDPGTAPTVFNVPDECLFAISLKPSHARAIASVILSAATAARG